MKRLAPSCLLACLALCRLAAHAQAPAPVGNGLRGDYYQGLNFDHLEGTRLDAQLDFDWQGQPPLRGMLADYFTVRWSGWLVPPVTGRYVLRLTVDDGARLWLDGKQLVDEWRGQPLGYYEAAVELQAGRAYRLRLDYAQYSLASRMQLAWERPRQPEALGSWRNLWNVGGKSVAANRRRELLPARYLFSQLPGPRRPAPPVAPPRPMQPVSLTSVQVRPPQVTSRTAVVRSSSPRHPPPPRPVAKPVVKPARITTARITVPSPRLPVAALRSSTPPLPTATAPLPVLVRPRLGDTLAARLTGGHAVTWRALYFEQGQARLPLPVQASLDTLAGVLARYPALRLEVQGHTDNQGDSALNRQLSRQRAEAVCQYLAAHGVVAARLRPVGLGGSRPVADNRRPAERSRNRRVVLRPLP